MKYHKIVVDWNKCKNCGFCTLINACYSKSSCIGCLSCFWACPYEARRIIEVEAQPRLVEIYVDGSKVLAPLGVSVATALEYLGFKFDKPGSRSSSLACRTGGCWACAVVINGSLERSCITPVKEGMNIETSTEGLAPLRIIHGPEPHTVGGKATPWWEVDYVSYVEAAIWTAGCNLRCPQCQNYHVTYDNTTPPSRPNEAARLVVACHKRYRTNGIAVSGGEPSINRRWLIEFFKTAARLVKPGTRLHLDSNGTVLTPDYVDELVEAGCNNIGVEPKCARVETYMEITGIKDRELAREYLETAWRAVEYIHTHYGDRVYLGVGLVYNKDLVTLNELAEAGRRIASVDPWIQVTVLDYFPTFRRRWIRRPTVKEMLEVKRVLEEQGLKTVIVQTSVGHIGPGERNMGLAKMHT
ncbi:MAG: radical SAM protein [Desulfurococcaceae archaeon]